MASAMAVSRRAASTVARGGSPVHLLAAARGPGGASAARTPAAAGTSLRGGFSGAVRMSLNSARATAPRARPAERNERRERNEREDRAAVSALVAAAAEGDAAAFGGLFDRFQPEIVRYFAIRVRDAELAADLAQQVFLKAWQAIPRYQDRGAPFSAWLYRMAHNQLVDYYRTRRPSMDLDGIEVTDRAPHADERLIASDRSAELSAALDELSEDHRRVLVLRFIMEKSAREIGEIMGRKEVTIRGLQLRALRALRAAIEARGGIA
jgi:RNA polymerase sigma-70 factor (ECF subfamily)